MSFLIPEFTTSTIDAGFTPEDEDTRKLYREVAAFAKQGQPIVIFGPAGSGKEFLARHYYNAFVKSDYYTKYKEHWQSKYSEIRNRYSSCYSGESLEVFLSSIKPGVFKSINSGIVYPNLAESILFGHEENSKSGASARPGLFELIKCGVLFIEEIGELSSDLQARLLRAFNTEISEGCRISGKINYSLRDVIIIPATNQPQDRIKKEFYYRMGIQVSIKGIDDRPKDVRKSIPHFIRKVIDKRKDTSIMGSIFGTSSPGNATILSETLEVKKFAEDQADMVADEILMRKWPGNFRALRTTLEASILRIEKPKNLASFSEEFLKNLKHYIKQYSEEDSNTYVPVERSLHDNVYPSRYPDMDRRILEKINSKNRFQDMSDFEKKILAVFLSSTHEAGFRRRDLEEYYKSFSGIRHSSEAHIRSKLNKLLAFNFLTRAGEGKSTSYNLTKSFLGMVTDNDAFALPDVDKNWADRSDEIVALTSLLSSIERIFIEAPARYGKSAFIAMFCHARQQMFNLYYYELGQGGIKRLFEDISKVIQNNKIYHDRDKFLKNAVKNIQSSLQDIFRIKNGKKPVLILDNAHFISEPDHMATLADMAKRWQEVILILVGDNMDNALLRDFSEFRLSPWGKQA